MDGNPPSPPLDGPHTQSDTSTSNAPRSSTSSSASSCQASFHSTNDPDHSNTNTHDQKNHGDDSQPLNTEFTRRRNDDGAPQPFSVQEQQIEKQECQPMPSIAHQTPLPLQEHSIAETHGPSESTGSSSSSTNNNMEGNRVPDQQGISDLKQALASGEADSNTSASSSSSSSPPPLHSPLSSHLPPPLSLDTSVPYMPPPHSSEQQHSHPLVSSPYSSFSPHSHPSTSRHHHAPSSPTDEASMFDRGALYSTPRTTVARPSVPTLQYPPPISRTHSSPDHRQGYDQHRPHGMPYQQQHGSSSHLPVHPSTYRPRPPPAELKSMPINLPSDLPPISSNHNDDHSNSNTLIPMNHPLRANNASNASLNSHYGGQPCSGTRTPAQLRPDSIVSYPEGSPLLAPHVLAAVDARLRETAKRAQNGGAGRQHSFGQSSAHSASVASSVHRFRGAAAAAGASPSSASSFNVVTHNNVLERNEMIKTREDLYDALNGDSDDEEAINDDDRPPMTDSNVSDLHLERPHPDFLSSTSSRRSSRYSMALSSSGLVDHRQQQTPIALKPMSGSSSFRGKSPNRSGSGGDHSANSRTSPSTLVGSTVDAASLKSGGGQKKVDPWAEKSEWLKRKAKADRRWRMACCTLGILLFIGAITGIVFGFIQRKHKVDGLASPGDTNSKLPEDRGPITEFTPNPNLRQAFYGVDYNPAKVIMPWCGATLQQVVDDMILLSQITKRVRLYGMDCNQADLTLQAIKALKKPMEVVLTIWVDKNATTYQRQYDTLLKVLDTHGTDRISGVSVGNEVLFRKDKTLAELSALMTSVRSDLKQRYGKDIPVFTSDIGNNLNSQLAAVSDMLQGNIHPFFAPTPADKSAEWTFAQYENLIKNNPVPSGTAGVISEIGWPTAPTDYQYQNVTAPGINELQTLIDTFVCQANEKNVPYYWFEFRDEPWKIDPEVKVEPYWGLFDASNKLKVKIPNCLAS